MIRGDELNPYGPDCDIAVAMDGCPVAETGHPPTLPGTGFGGAVGYVGAGLVLVGVLAVLAARSRARWAETLDRWGERPPAPKRIGRL